MGISGNIANEDGMKYGWSVFVKYDVSAFSLLLMLGKSLQNPAYSNNRNQQNGRVIKTTKV